MIMESNKAFLDANNYTSADILSRRELKAMPQDDLVALAARLQERLYIVSMKIRKERSWIYGDEQSEDTADIHSERDYI